MESNCPPKPHKKCASPRKKHKSDSNRDHDQGCGTWKMSFPQNGITVEDCIESEEPQEQMNFNPEWQGEPRTEVCEEEEECEETSPCTDTSNEVCTDSESTPESTGFSGQTACSRLIDQSDISGATDTSSQLKVDIEKFMVQKKKIIQQIKTGDPELFSEFCSCENKAGPWYCNRPVENNQPQGKQRSSKACQPGCEPKRHSKQEKQRRHTSESCENASSKRKSSPHHEAVCPRAKPQSQPCPKPKKQPVCAPPPSVCPKPQVNRCKPPAAHDICPPPVKPQFKPKPQTPQMHHEPPPEEIHTPCPSVTSCPKKSKPCLPKTCAPIITGDQKKDVEAKQTFTKIKKIELDSVLDRNVHDLSLDIPDRDPVLIASLMNSHVKIDDDPTEMYAAIVHPLGKNKLSATDVHHTDPGSMVPKQIPVTNLNQLSAEVLDELEAIFKSQGIAYPTDDLATAETRGLDVSEKEPEKPKIKPPPAPSLFKCTLELQPLRIENFFQLRGTNTPSWYPGMMASFPDGRSDLRVVRTPSGLIKTAYTFCRP